MVPACACFAKLRLDDSGQIQKIFSLFCGRFLYSRMVPKKRIVDFLAHFVTAGPDAGSERDQKICGIAAERGLHQPHAVKGDLLKRPPPSGMYGRNSTASRVCNENGDAIGRLHGKRCAPHCSEEPVPGERIPFVRHFFYYMNTAGMNLTQRGKPGIR